MIQVQTGVEFVKVRDKNIVQSGRGQMGNTSGRGLGVTRTGKVKEIRSVTGDKHKRESVSMTKRESRRVAMTQAYIVKGHVKDKRDNGEHTIKQTGGT